MERSIEKVYVSRKELDEFIEKLDDFMRQIQGIKSTIEILQDEETMDIIRESEKNRKDGKEISKIEI